MSAPPEVSSPSPIKDKGKERERSSSIRPPESTFEPQLPPSVHIRRQLSVVHDTKEEDEDEDVEEAEDAPPIASLADTMAEAGVETSVEGEEVEGSEEVDDENVKAVAQRIADGPQVVNRDTQSQQHPSHWLLRFLILALTLSSSGLLMQYKQESAAIGFCDAGTNTNVVLDELRARRVAIESCNRENRTILYIANADSTASVAPPAPTAAPGQGQAASDTTVELCPPPPLVPFVQPDECTPCPKHATCSPSSITCENGYILRPHPLLAAFPVPSTQKDGLHVFERPSRGFSGQDFPRVLYGVISSAFDGFPAVGSVAVPPRCVEDPRRKRHIGALGKAIESILANERGRRLCEGIGLGLPEGDEATEAQRWGLEIEKLREYIKEKTPVSTWSAVDLTEFS